MNKVILSCLLGILIFNSGELSGQKIIKGNVLDKYKQPIPGSSIFVKNSYIGSISSRDGKFFIKIPQNLQSNKLCISSIGYQTQEISIKKIQSPLQIQLLQDTCDLAEVLVMPKDTLLALLRRAYGKIKDNYPDFDTRMKGLYRETYYNPNKEEYLYFGEAQLDVFKTSYKTKVEGQVKIVNSRMNKHPLYDTLATVKWYGGVHSPIVDDNVKMKAHYLSSDGLMDYEYNIYKDVLDAKPVYRIDFKPKKNRGFSYKGKFYLDINSLAYLYSECTYTEYGILKRNKKLSDNGLEVQQRKIIVKYRKWNDRYYLSYISDEEKLIRNKTNSELIQFDEFLVTDIQTQNVKPIIFSEQSKFRDVFYLKADEVNESTWTGEQMLLPDSSLNQLIEYTPDKAQVLLNKQHELPKKYKFEQKLIEVITRMYFDMNFIYQPSDVVKNASIHYSPQESQLFKGTQTDSDPYYTFGMKMGYKLNPHLDVNFEIQESVGKNFSNLSSIGFAYETPLINRGNQLLLIAGFNYYFLNNGQYINDFKSKSNFKAGGKNIKADRIALYVGKIRQGISFDLGLKTKLSELYSVFVMGGYQCNISDRDRLFIKEKSGFFLTRKTTDISLKDSSIQYFENGVQTTKTCFDTKDFYFKAGIRFAF